jgi:hypothetical protein
VSEKRLGSQHLSREERTTRQAPLDTDDEWRRKNKQLNDSHGTPEEEEEEERRQEREEWPARWCRGHLSRAGELKVNDSGGSD